MTAAYNTGGQDITGSTLGYPDGNTLGQATTDAISFYGVTPVARQASTVDIATQLSNLGLVPSGSAIQGSGAPVAVTGNVTLSAGTHAGRIVTLNAAAGLALTPPSATGTGNVYFFYVGTTVTSNNITFIAQGSDKIVGVALQTGSAGATTSFLASGSGTTISLNGSTKGGIKGDTIEVRDVATNVWSVRVTSSITGSAATPFS